MRYFLRLAYDGAPFHGWQRQPGDSSVQQRLEEALSVVMRRPVEIVGAGRTDAGVHAREMYAHFDAGVFDADARRRILRGVNSLCGGDVVVYDLLPVVDDAHARFSATARTYKYFITLQPDPFLRRLAWHCPSTLDMEAMNEAAARLLEISDFTSFAKLHSDARTNICRVSRADWRPLSDSRELPAADVHGMVFTITADRFLRNMVRAVVGTLLDVGRGTLSQERFLDVIERRDRCAAGQSVPAHALYLWKVDYPKDIFI